MCGFAGTINNEYPLHREQVAAIAACVQFRGPDSCGVKLYNDAMQPAERGIHAFFFNRLAILDMDPRSNQPFEDERYTLLFNGEIYNYQSLRDELRQKGFAFHTTSDTEVLFYALQCWNVQALTRLNGMFAFCFVDRKEHTFIVARDRLGIKPLYYSSGGKGFVFSSELHSVLRLLPEKPEIDVKAVEMYLWMQSIPTPYTGIKQVLKLPPGHYIQSKWSKANPVSAAKPQPFWDAYTVVQHTGSKATDGDFEQLLTDTLKRQMVADVPLGLFLSSGVDSSLLAALVHTHFSKDREFNFYTVAFSEATESDESRDAVQYIRGFNNPALSSHTLVIDPSFIGKQLDSLYDFVDEPFADPAVLLNRVIAVKAREQVTVALSGDGADELFWGYNRYRYWKHQMVNLGNKLTLKGNLTRLAGYLLPVPHHRSLAALAAEVDPVKRHFNYFVHPFFSKTLSSPVYENDIWALSGLDAIKNREDLTAILDLKTYLADAMLYKVDRSSMAASLEVRVPYLDNQVVDYALAMPLQEKSDATYNHKAPLKALLQRLAPHYQVNKPKKGFSFPLDRWLSTTWKAKVTDLLHKQSVNAVGLDDSQFLPAVHRYYSGKSRYCLPVWYLLNLVMWKQKLDQITPLHKI